MVLGTGIHRTPLPKKFLASGVNCGIRQYRPDLGLIISEIPSVGVGVFTESTCQAAPVKYSKSLLPSTAIRAIITNSGQANAATGMEGILNNARMVNILAQQLNCKSTQILTASTGLIGAQLAINKIMAAIPDLVADASTVADKFALAILTTDLVPKTISQEITLSEGKIRITGIAKGSGMIHPNMATMLGYILTDAKLTMDEAKCYLHEAVNKSFNMISVDGETSTNDCAFLLANGASGIELKTEQDKVLFQTACNNIAIILAKAIARDGEGATKLIEVQVKGAPDYQLATKVARVISASPLIKTAIHGESANWGRVLAKLGAERISPHLLSICSIYFQKELVFQQNQPQATDLNRLKEAMKDDQVEILIDFSSGSHEALAWSCDLSQKYVKINAEYLS